MSALQIDFPDELIDLIVEQVSERLAVEVEKVLDLIEDPLAREER